MTLRPAWARVPSGIALDPGRSIAKRGGLPAHWCGVACRCARPGSMFPRLSVEKRAHFRSKRRQERQSLPGIIHSL